MKTRLVAGMILSAAILGGTVVQLRPDLALKVATGTYAHDICSKTFVSGMEPDRIIRESLAGRAGLNLIAWGMRPAVDREGRVVSVSFLGRAVSQARFRPRLGCTLVFEGQPLVTPAVDWLALDAAIAATSVPPLAGPVPVTPRDPRLAAALERAFAENSRPPLRQTKAVLVLRDGALIAERYAEGIGIETPLLGFSMTKTVTTALVGILVAQGRLSPDAPAPIAAWSASGDPRGSITLEHLMRMVSGLDLDETGTGFDPSNRMFYTRADMAAFAQAAGLRAQPGTRFAYSSASTHLLARIVADTVGGSRAVLDFAWRDLFAPLGMSGVTLELDAAGIPVGAHYMLAPARSWARFGEFYRMDGMVAGRRILPEGWVALSARQTLNSSYGAGLWTNRVQTDAEPGPFPPGMPADAFMMVGNLGQRIVILPTQRLVIVRLGDDMSDGRALGLGQLVSDVIAAVAD